MKIGKPAKETGYALTIPRTKIVDWCETPLFAGDNRVDRLCKRLRRLFCNALASVVIC
ncbi:hypothetical protein [Bacteroides eggerthii]|uniref:hypothetical protein n=1 Tax=Bacteroides eggerthii TaxID=28111 RepID=UPI0032197AC1